eukprot:16802-Rhodomonas_salina.1
MPAANVYSYTDCASKSYSLCLFAIMAIPLGREGSILRLGPASCCGESTVVERFLIVSAASRIDCFSRIHVNVEPVP